MPQPKERKRERREKKEACDEVWQSVIYYVIKGQRLIGSWAKRVH